MIDWEEIAGAGDEDKLKNAKLWLFQENIRLENERKELEASRENFLNERVRFRRELEELNRCTVQERKRLKEESLFLKRNWQFCRMVSGSLKKTERLWSSKKKHFPGSGFKIQIRKNC